MVKRVMRTWYKWLKMRMQRMYREERRDVLTGVIMMMTVGHQAQAVMCNVMSDGLMFGVNGTSVYSGISKGSETISLFGKVNGSQKVTSGIYTDNMVMQVEF